MDQPLEHRKTESLLRVIAEGTTSVVGGEFFHVLVHHLAEALGVKYAFVAEFAGIKTRVRTLAFWEGDHFLDNFEYELAGTPCEAVLAGEMRLYKQGVWTLFPKGPALAGMKAESYLAIPLSDTEGKVLGHLAVLDTKPMGAAPDDLSIFNIFAARARAELERQQAEEALKRSEERLSSVLTSAMDAIITIDDERYITLFNPAAERVFRCASSWAVGQPFDRFLSRRFRSLLERYLQAVDDDGGVEQMWAPEGLTAVRANREEFPIEATISPFKVGGQRLYTLILRDMNERKQAQAEIEQLQWEKSYLQEEVGSAYRFENIVGESPAMRRLSAHVEQVAGTDTTVLLTGETGTGKELIAHALHSLSARKDRLLVKMNCAALPAKLIESELFGHEKGAFTGAITQRKGRFELADGGTLFLDEVGELSAPAQAKLLRVLQDQEFERVGGIRTLKVDAWVTAATNRDLGEMVKAGSFRSDLFYRLHVFPIEVPPLRERHEDILLLVDYFLQRFARKLGKPLKVVSERSMEQLVRYTWPGNVRELQNVIERAAVLARGPIVEIDKSLGMQLEAGVQVPLTDATLEAVERAHILRVLQDTGLGH